MTSRKNKIKTQSEEIFEKFLKDNNLPFYEIKESETPRPDYLVKAGDLELVFEVKELAEDMNFKTEPFAISSRIVGEHVRKKISDARKQIQFTANSGFPSILLIYNDIDPLHLFGTENHDFVTAMYGEYTIVFDKNTRKVMDNFYGLNKSFSMKKNTSFSAVGKLFPCLDKIEVTLFENVFSKVKIQFDKLPPCFDVVRFQVR